MRKAEEIHAVCPRSLAIACQGNGHVERLAIRHIADVAQKLVALSASVSVALAEIIFNVTAQKMVEEIERGAFGLELEDLFIDALLFASVGKLNP